jgi:hypothetical protein
VGSIPITRSNFLNFMSLPLWAFFGIAAAILSSCMMLLQEHFRVNGYTLAFWNKTATLMIAFPFMLMHAWPTDPLFYVFIALTAVLYSISDVVFFTSIPKSSAGAVARVVPIASVLGFLLWFVINPSLFVKYVQHPVISLLIFTTLCLFAVFAFRLKKCEFTMQTLRFVWFVIFAATVGPMLSKLMMFHATREQAVFIGVSIQSIMMMSLMMLFIIIRKPVPVSDLFVRDTWQKGLIVGATGGAGVLLKYVSFYYVDNPAYVPAIMALDSVMILLFYKATGRKIEGDIFAGLGIVFCAAALIILKAQV